MLLAFDPGITTGFAYFDARGRLRACGITGDGAGKHASVLPCIGLGDRVIIERPKIYPGGRTKNPNDVLSVALNAGEWKGWARAQGVEAEYIEPAQWKGGNVPKDIQNARDAAKLGPDELAVVAQCGAGMPKGKREHFLDALGIGLRAVGR